MYTIGDFLIKLKNASRAYKKTVEYPYSNAVFSIAKILEKEGFVNKVSAKDEDSRRLLKIDLKYKKNVPAISEIKLISKPSVHHYVGKNKMARVERNAVGIVTTNKGVMTIRDAQKQGVGGELICQIF
ncbi:MAG: 30S ribosomal protein S8 [Candidatus Levybacteria bacterium RIFCSPHIGHO2_02_FULL_40_18]|nr:MAG: 30S ribosomal protein S8 [Candidatus Levybacteria bacterium RIFCSPHIGHO2_01_FULL_40_58]OGH26397.1 MAG: 30S ribosomal protein S8 [Candidatus Levybacteria bacterium RIFCSPHIGHO2_02_FULL_40_18]OGH31845.1 MAG: 30S ribosomal protein S8 [Candidatus Levybacteria bacterium RIFCSPHIGHO2_12_FULL_40_31]OGH40478.1 MAG: 30S ribosomal protein S8 [Candidatus Levybacteria bacterium RIFCSPLOWO2_01_FULL_40_64]OGH49187.1 MAG: 30S ribosomal protein S8 [Candidatus Levybacteria bacterium RIFCSPLOWO2_02_FULL_